MNPKRRFLMLGVLAAVGVPAAVATATATPETIAVHHVGPVTYVDVDRSAILDGVLGQKEASMYPLELDFLWGRGAKQTPLGGIKWSVATPAGHALVHAPASGPVVLAALPDGRYVITAWFNGTPVQRTVTVRTGEHRTVPLEWMP